MKERPDSTTLKITNQFRSRTGFAYDLKAHGARLMLTISARQAPEDPGEWFATARAGSAPEAAAIEAWGPTRLEALRAVARSWTDRARELQLPTFDWDAVAKALTDVRAV